MEALKAEELHNPFFPVWLPFPASTELYCIQAVSKINWFCFISISVVYKVRIVKISKSLFGFPS